MKEEHFSLFFHFIYHCWCSVAWLSVGDDDNRCANAALEVEGGGGSGCAAGLDLATNSLRFVSDGFMLCAIRILIRTA